MRDQTLDLPTLLLSSSKIVNFIKFIIFGLKIYLFRAERRGKMLLQEIITDFVPTSDCKLEE